MRSSMFAVMFLVLSSVVCGWGSDFLSFSQKSLAYFNEPWKSTYYQYPQMMFTTKFSMTKPANAVDEKVIADHKRPFYYSRNC